jgi:16S rRNA (adenine1518-N6/adenine1519-N6)-dimethyltransferase
LIKAKKSLGQNFLHDESIIQRIIESVRAKNSDIIFEIGPGTGALTRLLIKQSGLLVAVELDSRLIEKLRAGFTGDKVMLIEADALTVDWPGLLDSALSRWRDLRPESPETPRLRIVANLPYYISTPIIERLLTVYHRLFDMTLMLQEEVVDRIVSQPGGKEYGYLSVFVQYFCEAEKLFRVPPTAFSPEPKVHSAIVNLRCRQQPIIDIQAPEKFFGLIRSAFAQRRKTILNNLKAAASISDFAVAPDKALQNCGLDAMRRAETFSIQDFATLYHSLFSK